MSMAARKTTRPVLHFRQQISKPWERQLSDDACRGESGLDLLV